MQNSRRSNSQLKPIAIICSHSRFIQWAYDKLGNGGGKFSQARAIVTDSDGQDYVNIQFANQAIGREFQSALVIPSDLKNVSEISFAVMSRIR